MAKKKSKSIGRKKKTKKFSLKPFLSSVKQLSILAFIAVVVLISLLFLYKCFFTSEKKENIIISKKENIKKSEKPISPPSIKTIKKESTKTFQLPANLEIPILRNNSPQQIIKHEGYTVSYNSDYKIANWVAYELTSQEAKSKKAERSNKFIPDPLVKSASATNEDYTRTGYDRGHLAPAGDMKWSGKAMMESFYFSNITPQKPGLNRGKWKELEEQSRMWAQDNGPIYIATGPVIKKDLRRLGKNRVGIPEKFYKVIVYINHNKEYKGVGFIFDNKDYKNTPLQQLAVPIDSVEKLTDIDFFPILPDKEENEMEKEVDWSAWSF